ncbi:hypothetical protein G6F57_016114 [Rhizopus arrhizus]|uniref:Uncharacterized protein n=1 Tax=Rhizopus oryzae TaxID=64495 RepID=A0A9P7BKA5_RHIOR|nr:hypothetical protein G6F23_012485 [Rhizopus arrhizus]KAG0752392.1 hypothetical protein G6F24_013606 [Rhizopus arrhizus]KAG0774400.1 hypothetical protein G6F22_014091 [Rhizopus arrhizus]KAG0778266.1 hypothetical protein G6F21_013058 [Rhizopus arrhizus]KAG0803951.1 hypothetical protein G6F20_013083 [Rhizopus arrhizus]
MGGIQIENKRKWDDEPEGIPIATKKVAIALNEKATILTFINSKVSMCSTGGPKLTAKAINELSDMVQVIDNQVQLLKEEQEAGNSFNNLKHHHTTYMLLKDALNKPLDGIIQWLWRHECPDDVEDQEKDLLQAVKLILTHFAGNHMVPIFDVFADQTGLLNFRWCEIYLQAHAGTNPGMVRYMDGLGLDLSDTERIVMESSSGEHKENVKHTEDDTLKQIHSSITMLKTDINNHRNAAFSTMCQIETFGIHCVKKETTLSKTKLNGATGGYIYQEIRSAEIPVTYEERHKWLKMADLLATLMNLLIVQQKIKDQLDKENSGYVFVSKSLRVQSVLGI